MLTFDEYIDKVKTFKAEKQNWEDLPPMLDFCLTDGQGIVLPWDGEPYTAAKQAATVTILGDVDTVWFVGDMLCNEDHTPEEPGAMPDRWQRGERDGLVEIMVIMKVTRDSVQGVELDYDSTTRTWGEQHDTTEKIKDDGLVQAIQLGAFHMRDGQHIPEMQETLNQGRANPILRASAALLCHVVPDPQDLLALLAAQAGQAAGAPPKPDPYHSVRLSDYIRKD